MNSCRTNSRERWFAFVVVSVILLQSSLAPAAISDPRDLEGNVLWLDASDLDGDFSLGGTLVGGTTWIDKSPLQNAHATQAAASRLPSMVESDFNGLTILEFDGNDFMDIDSAAFGMLRNVESATMIGVLTTERNSSNRGMRALMVSSGTNSAGTRAGINLFDSFGTSIGGTGDFGLAGRRLDSDEFQRIEGGELTPGQLSTMTGVFDYQAGELTLLVDGEQETQVSDFQTAGNTSDTDSLNIRIGADAVLGNPRGFFTGQIAELMVFDRALSVEEIGDVESYIFDKWLAANTCEPFNSLLGDFDGSGTVEFADFLALSTNFGSETENYSDGDANCDGTVAFDDFLTLSSNFGATLVANTTQSVPEPSAFTLCGLLVVLLPILLESKRRAVLSYSRSP